MNREEELLNIIKELKEEKQRWNSKVWYLNNRERQLNNSKKNYTKNRDNILIYKCNWGKKHRDENPEYHRNRHKQYNKTEGGYKTSKKGDWKKKGLNMENFEEIYKRYCETTNCDNCNVLLTTNKKGAFKCMDHSHVTGEFRNILCIGCNIRRGENNL